VDLFDFFPSSLTVELNFSVLAAGANENAETEALARRKLAVITNFILLKKGSI